MRKTKKPAGLKRVSIETLLNKGVEVLHNEIDKLMHMSTNEETPLSGEHSRLLTDYLRVLLLMSKNERNQRLEESLAEMSDKELNELAKEATRFLLEEDGKAELQS